eukprot:15466547-Alexandrium_andersonii.AAC.1
MARSRGRGALPSVLRHWPSSPRCCRAGRLPRTRRWRPSRRSSAAAATLPASCARPSPPR